MWTSDSRPSDHRKLGNKIGDVLGCVGIFGLTIVLFFVYFFEMAYWCLDMVSNVVLGVFWNFPNFNKIWDL